MRDLELSYSNLPEPVENLPRAGDFRAAHECDLWFDPEREQTCLVVDGVPVPVQHPRRDGECPVTSHRSVRLALGEFKRGVIEALAPGLCDRRVRHFLALSSHEAVRSDEDGLAKALRTAAESGACELAWGGWTESRKPASDPL